MLQIYSLLTGTFVVTKQIPEVILFFYITSALLIDVTVSTTRLYRVHIFHTLMLPVKI